MSRDLACLAPDAPPAAAAGPPDGEAERLVPLKTYSGFFAAESLDTAQRRRLEAATGEHFGWGAPIWLNWALWWSSGKQTIADIARLLRHEDREVPLPRLVGTFRLLGEFGFVRFRPFLQEDDICHALRTVGVVPGSVLMVHSSLSAFGYVANGATACINALRTVLGPEGTLAMPTHSLNALGHPTYDAAKSPSLVGAVTEAFRRLPGVLRSAHPTHSVAVQGPQAEPLTVGHHPGMAPLARNGFWGRFVEADGWVLMMAPMKSCTLMHACELWSGVPLPSYPVPVREDGRWHVRDVPSGPWHSNWFARLHETLAAAGQVATAPLGEGEIRLMRAREVVEAGLRLFRGNPLLVCKERCTCGFCQRVQAGVAARNGSAGPSTTMAYKPVVGP